MTDPNHSSDDEEKESEQTNESTMEEAAKARKRRLLEMKSKLHGIEMKEEDYKEDAEATKKSRTEEKEFRNYQPISDKVAKFEGGLRQLDMVEQEISEHLRDAEDMRPIESVDLTTLAPKKIDWDLKRDIEEKMQKLERRTQRAIANIIRERLAEGKQDLASVVNSGAVQ
ncbi:hypothetical protein WR25_02875 [Diploscapter pachys]|uniref:Cwf18 pre-mRNA splicing factor n=1 Tax=Diploscapter pachys TaxID=2018661 RepID=A0A2A2LEX0_9BILA|nr:hypothetical protein WR25_02875 [Diploscapter pachys]